MESTAGELYTLQAALPSTAKKRGVHGTVRFPPTQAMPTTQEQKLTLPSFDTPSLGSKSAYFSGNVYIIYPLYPAHTCRRDTWQYIHGQCVE